MSSRVVLVSNYPFEGNPVFSQLAFPAGATIELHPRDQANNQNRSDWWFGYCNGQRGWFPPTYCRLLEPNEYRVTTTTTTTTAASGVPESDLFGSRDDEKEEEPVTLMGGPTDHIHAAARNFGTSPTFNPALEDYDNAHKKSPGTWLEHRDGDADQNDRDEAPAGKKKTSKHHHQQRRKPFLFGAKKVAAVLHGPKRGETAEHPQKPVIRIVSADTDEDSNNSSVAHRTSSAQGPKWWRRPKAAHE